jgi:hypothetical protein
MKCEFGICLCCDTAIATTCPTCTTRKPNELYTEVLVNLSNGSKMPIAVCVDCTQDIFQKDRKEIMAAIRAAWTREHDTLKWSRDQRDAYWKTHGEGILEIVD